MVDSEWTGAGIDKGAIMAFDRSSPIGPDKLQIVSDYLHAEFADCEIADRYDFDLDAHRFRMTKRGELFLLKISRAFLDDHTPAEIAAQLRNREVSRALRQYVNHRALLTSRGVLQLQDP